MNWSLRGVIESKPGVKIQSTSAAPGIATAPRSVVQVPMTDNVPTDSGEVSASASVLPARVHVSRDEDDKVEDEESGHDDLPDHAMKTDCTHVCIYRLTDTEGGEKRYCNKPLKLFRSTQ